MRTFGIIVVVILAALAGAFWYFSTPDIPRATLDGELAFRGEVLSPDGKEFADTDFRMQLESDPLDEAAQAGRAAAMAIKWRAERWLDI